MRRLDHLHPGGAGSDEAEREQAARRQDAHPARAEPRRRRCAARRSPGGCSAASHPRRGVPSADVRAAAGAATMPSRCASVCTSGELCACWICVSRSRFCADTTPARVSRSERSMFWRITAIWTNTTPTSRIAQRASSAAAVGAMRRVDVPRLAAGRARGRRCGTPPASIALTARPLAGRRAAGPTRRADCARARPRPARITRELTTRNSGLASAAADGQVGRADAAVRRLAEAMLDDPVLERVERDARRSVPRPRRSRWPTRGPPRARSARR